MVWMLLDTSSNSCQGLGLTCYQSNRASSLQCSTGTCRNSSTSSLHRVKSLRPEYPTLRRPSIRPLDTRQQLGDIKQSNMKYFEKAERSNQSRFDESKRERQRELFLQSLFFPEIHERQNTIHSAAPRTFDWILNPRGNPSQSSFRIWLTQDTSTYWVCGKAGSGKSTLMAYIVEQEETRRALQLWSQHRELYILSFFFWLPGSELQRSTIGLLRSILYQICQARPDLIEIIMKGLSIGPEVLPKWTEKYLSAAVFSRNSGR